VSLAFISLPSSIRLISCRNCEKLKEKSRQRAKAYAPNTLPLTLELRTLFANRVKEYQKMHETPAEVADRKERHRLASAKYRQRNRKEISEKERKRRPG